MDEESIFAAVIEIQSPDERTAYLSRVCADDPALKARIEAVVRAHEQPDSFFDAPVTATPVTVDGESTAERPGATIGRYKLLEEIGEGGFGIVYMAEQREPVRRKVALKIIKPGMDTRAVVARFEAERQALALMDHPNIAHVFDGGATDSGRPYFVMELVHGIPLTEYCDQEQLTTRQRLELFAQVCHAAQHAHQKGIIHRDLKPSNVMVTLYDGVPVPKVIDFGVAKATGGQLTEKTAFTGYGQMIGTPLYMSPEQTALSALDVDTRSDIYSLGVLLYELLTGSTPFDGQRIREAGYDEIRRIIREEEPPRPSTRISTLGAAATTISAHRQTDSARLSRLLRRELDWIVMKALEKDRTRRYQTASDFARDIERYLADEPIEARPPTLFDRAAKWSRRHRPVVWSGIAVALIAMAAVVASSVLVFAAYEREKDQRYQAEASAVETDQQRKLADQQKAEAVRLQGLAEEHRRSAQRHLYAAHMQVAHQAWEDGHIERASALLDKYLPAPGTEEDMRSFDWYYLWRLCHSERLCLWHIGSVEQVRFSVDGKILATAAPTAYLYDATTGQVLQKFRKSNRACSVAFSPDGKLQAIGYDHGGVDLRDTANWQVQAELERETYGVEAMVFSPDSKWLATANGPTLDQQGDSSVKVWDLATRKVLMTRVQPQSMVTGVDFSPDGKMLAAAWGQGQGSGGASLWDCATWEERAIHPEWKSDGVCFSPDGKTLAAGMGGVTLLDPATGEDRLRIPKGGEWTMAFSPDGKTVATGGWDQVVRLWDVATGQERRVLKGHVEWIFSVAFSPDGKTLASASRDGAVRLWDLTAEPEGEVLPGPPGASVVAFSPDGRSVAAAGANGSISLSDVATARQTATLSLPPGSITAMAFAADGTTLAVALSEGGKPAEVRLLGIEKKQDRALENPSGASCCVLAFSPDGAVLAGGGGTEVRLWDVPTCTLRGTLAGHVSTVESLSFSPDGERLAVGTRASSTTERTTTGLLFTGQEFGELRVWDLPSQRKEVAFRWTLNSRGVAFSRDGKLLAAAGSNHFQGPGGGKARVWEVGTWRDIATLEGHRCAVSSVAFSSDGKVLVTAGEDGAVRLWDTTTWQERLVLRWPDQPISGLSLSSDASILAALSVNGGVRVWRAAGQADVSQYLKDADYRTWITWMRRARADCASDEWERVAANYSKAIEAKPDEPLAWYWRAVAYAEKGEHERAIADLTEAIRLDPRGSVQYRYRGYLQWEERAFDEAIADFTEAIRLDPGDALAYLERGQASIEKHDIDKAIADLSKAVQLQSTDANYWYRRALARVADARTDQYRGDCAEMLQRFGETNRPDQAHWVAWACALAPDAAADWPTVIALAEQAAESDPKSLMFVTTVGAVLYRAGRLEEAIQRLAQADALVKDPPDPNLEYSPAYAWFFLAMAHHRLGHSEDSKQWLDKAVAWSDTALREHEQRAKYLTWNRRLTLNLLRAEAHLIRTTAFEAHLIRTTAFSLKGEYDRKIAQASKAIRLNPRLDTAYQQRASVHFDKGELEQGIADLSDAIRLVGQPRYYWRRGIAYRDLGMFDQAVADLNEAFRSGDYRQGDYSERVLTCLIKGDVDTAMADSEEMIRLRPQAADGYVARGGSHWFKRDFDRALADFDKAQQLATIRLLFYYRAECCRDKGDFQRAFSDLSEAIRLDPKYAEAYRRRAVVRVRLGQFQAASDDVAHAIRVGQQTLIGKHEMAWFLATAEEPRLRDVDGALQLANEAISVSPSSILFQNTLGVAQYRAGNWKDALAALEKAERLRGLLGAGGWFFRAMTYWQMGQKDQARTAYDEAVTRMEEVRFLDQDLHRFRAEAAQLLGIL